MGLLYKASVIGAPARSRADAVARAAVAGAQSIPPPATNRSLLLTRWTLCAGRHQVKSVGIAGMHTDVGHGAILLTASAERGEKVYYVVLM